MRIENLNVDKHRVDFQYACAGIKSPNNNNNVMANTKEFFLNVTQRIFSNWTALRVIIIQQC